MTSDQVVQLLSELKVTNTYLYYFMKIGFFAGAAVVTFFVWKIIFKPFLNYLWQSFKI